MKKLSILLPLLVLAIGITSCGNKKPNKSNNDKAGGNEKNKTVGVQVFIVKPTSFAEELEVPGTILANESVEIHPEIAGRLVALFIQEGKTVEKGTLIAKLYDGDLIAQLKKLEVQLQLAQKTEERQAQLLKIQGISQQDYDISLLQVNNLKADIGIIKTNLEKTEIKAPFTGKMGLKNISVGAYVTPAAVITSLHQTTILKVDFTVPEKYTPRIKVGQKLSLTAMGSNEVLTATITATSASMLENSRSLQVRAQLNNPGKTIMPGSFAKIKIGFDPDLQAKLIPTQSILPQARGKKVILYKNGIAIFQDITTGVRNAEQVQITEGLNIGDTVVTTGLMNIRPEAKLTITKVVNAPL
jgi:membrane fusion protein (multidrug efflux system)